MNEVHKDLEYMSYPSASGVVARSYCTISGDLASATCAKTATGYYKTSNIPAKCKNCAMIHAIGSEIPDKVTAPSATTTEETTKKNDKNKKPTKNNKVTTTHAPSTTAPVTTEPTTAPDTTEAVATVPSTDEAVVE